jgi:hypothetical protein
MGTATVHPLLCKLQVTCCSSGVTFQQASNLVARHCCSGRSHGARLHRCKGTIEMTVAKLTGAVAGRSMYKDCDELLKLLAQSDCKLQQACAVFGSAPVWPPGLNEAAHHAKRPAQAHHMRHQSQACTSTINHMLTPCILLLLVSVKTFKWMVMDAMRACVIYTHQHAPSASAHLRSLGRRLCHRVDAQLDDLCSKVFFTLRTHSICGHN